MEDNNVMEYNAEVVETGKDAEENTAVQGGVIIAVAMFIGSAIGYAVKAFIDKKALAILENEDNQSADKPRKAKKGILTRFKKTKQDAPAEEKPEETTEENKKD